MYGISPSLLLSGKIKGPYSLEFHNGSKSSSSPSKVFFIFFFLPKKTIAGI
jgi:hypothetical protein